MGFFDEFGPVIIDALDNISVPPQLLPTYQHYRAMGYELVSRTEISITMKKENLVFADDVQTFFVPEAEREPEPPNEDVVPCDANYVDDGFGMCITVTLGQDFPEGSVAAFRVADKKLEYLKSIKSTGLFADDDGDFTTVAPIYGREVRTYIPFGALEYRKSCKLNVAAIFASPGTGGGDLQRIGCNYFEIKFPSNPGWSLVEYICPIVNLAMAVVRADGSVSREELAHLKKFFVDQFELQPDNFADLGTAMKAASAVDVGAEFERFLMRFPHIPPVVLLRLLSEVALADGTVSETEVDVISAVARGFGVADEDLKSILDELGLGCTEDDDYETLGLDRGVKHTQEEIRTAYRQKANEYHPDRVEKLPPEFRMLANEIMAKVNAAYERLRTKV